MSWSHCHLTIIPLLVKDPDLPKILTKCRWESIKKKKKWDSLAVLVQPVLHSKAVAEWLWVKQAPGQAGESVATVLCCHSSWGVQSDCSSLCQPWPGLDADSPRTVSHRSDCTVCFLVLHVQKYYQLANSSFCDITMCIRQTVICSSVSILFSFIFFSCLYDIYTIPLPPHFNLENIRGAVILLFLIGIKSCVVICAHQLHTCNLLPVTM